MGAPSQPRQHHVTCKVNKVTFPFVACRANKDFSPLKKLKVLIKTPPLFEHRCMDRLQSLSFFILIISFALLLVVLIKTCLYPICEGFPFDYSYSYPTHRFSQNFPDLDCFPNSLTHNNGNMDWSSSCIQDYAGLKIDITE